jgi:hypothetical protein
LVFTLFHIPYVVLYLIGWAEWDDRAFFSASAANRAICCATLCGIGFLIGYELGALGRAQGAPFVPTPRTPASLFQACQLLVFALFALAALTLIIGMGPELVTYGYAAFMRGEVHGVAEETKRIVSLAVTLAEMGLILYVAGALATHGKIHKGVLIPVMIAGAILFFMLLGSRSRVALLGLPLLCGYHYFVKSIKLWLGIPLFLGAMVLFAVIGVGRSAESLSPVDFYEAYTDYQQKYGVHPLVMTLATTGTSIKTVNVACEFVPDREPYWYGLSVWDSVTMIVPSPFMGLRDRIVPSLWVTYMATGRVGGRQSGWGSSMAMEAYINFGLIGGACFTALIGFMMRRIYDSTLRRPTFVRICILLMSISGMALWCRNYSHHFIRPVVWLSILAWFVWSLTGAARDAPGRDAPSESSTLGAWPDGPDLRDGHEPSGTSGA